MNYVEIDKCRICGNKDLTEVIHFEPQFLSPTFVKSNLNNPLADIKVPLTVLVCDQSNNKDACGLVQLKETTDHELLYKDYFYRSATNETMRRDLKNVVDTVLSKVETKDGDVVVDIASNDGTMISFFPTTLKRFGVEPASNITWDHLDPSITVVNNYFSKDALEPKLGDEKVKIFTCCAMFYDLDNPNSFVADVKSLLAPDGVWCIQLSNLLSMLKNMNFYDICHEHLEYYSLETLNAVMERNGLTAYDAELNAVNGGSARVFITHLESAPQKTEALKALLAEEETFHLKDPQTLVAFDLKIKQLAETVRGYLQNEIAEGKHVIGLGASTKGNVILQYCGLTPAQLPAIAEVNPDKFGALTPGSLIPIVSEAEAHAMKPDYFLAMPWHFRKNLVKREAGFLSLGGRMIFPLPEISVVGG